jgi:hypothetical protein
MSFEQALAEEPGRVSNGDWRFAPLTGKGLYADQLNRYLEGGLDRSRLQVVLLEDLVAEPESALATIQNFLGVEAILTEMPLVNRAKVSVLPFPIRRLLFWNRRRSVLVRKALAASFRVDYPEPMKPETRAKLVEMFIGPNEELAHLIDRDLSGWNR